MIALIARDTKKTELLEFVRSHGRSSASSQPRGPVLLVSSRDRDRALRRNAGDAEITEDIPTATTH